MNQIGAGVILGRHAASIPSPGVGYLPLPPVFSSTDHAPDLRPVFRLASVERSWEGLDQAEEQMPPEEKVRSKRFVRQADRSRFILGRTVLRSMLFEHLGIDTYLHSFETGAYGKPLLATHPDIDFNIAHSGDLVLVSVCRQGQIGVDIEMHNNNIDFEAVCRTIFTSTECEFVLSEAAVRKPQRFFRQWCLKEAMVKALGTGLILDPHRFNIEETGEALIVRYTGIGTNDIGTGWQIETIAVGEKYSAAAVWRSPR